MKAHIAIIITATFVIIAMLAQLSPSQAGCSDLMKLKSSNTTLGVDRLTLFQAAQKAILLGRTHLQKAYNLKYPPITKAGMFPTIYLAKAEDGQFIILAQQQYYNFDSTSITEEPDPVTMRLEIDSNTQLDDITLENIQKISNSELNNPRLFFLGYAGNRLTAIRTTIITKSIDNTQSPNSMYSQVINKLQIPVQSNLSGEPTPFRFSRTAYSNIYVMGLSLNDGGLPTLKVHVKATFTNYAGQGILYRKGKVIENSDVYLTADVVANNVQNGQTSFAHTVENIQLE